MKKRLASLAATLVMTVSLLSGAVLNAVPVQAAEGEEKTLIYALGASWNTIDPFSLSQYYGIEVSSKIFDQLISINADHEIVPKAASSWESADDAKTIIFHLNENSKWHDGEPVTANDWVFTFNLVSSPEYTGGTKSNLNIIEGTDALGNIVEGETLGVEALDDYTLALHLKIRTNPDALLTVQGRFYYSVLPEHILKDVDPADLATSDFWSNPVGSGPFIYESEIEGSEIVLKAFKDYYLGSPKIDTLIYRVVDVTNQATAMAAGEIDVVYPAVTTEEAKSLEGLYDNVVVNVSEKERLLYHLDINNERLNDRVRYALSQAIDKQFLVDELALGDGVVATGIISDTTPYYNWDVKFEYNPEEAKQILDEEGWDYDRVITLGTAAGIRQNIASIIQQNWETIGVKTDVIVVDPTTIFAGLNDGTFDMAITTANVTWIPTYFKNRFNPESASATAPTVSTYFDYLSAMVEELDLEKRIEIAKEFQEVYAAEVPTIPLFEEFVHDIRSARTKNVTSMGTDQPLEWDIVED